MPDPALIRNALIAKLGSDAALLAQAVNGVYYKVGPQNSTRFVIVSQVTAAVVSEFQRRAFEDRLFMVEARFLKGAGGDIGVAAARIDALLDPQPPAQPPTLTVSGYSLMTMALEEPIDEIEPDDLDKSLFWYRRGGWYRVQMSLDS